jgi:hypothetical protein
VKRGEVASAFATGWTEVKIGAAAQVSSVGPCSWNVIVPVGW